MAQANENPNTVSIASGTTDVFATEWTFERVEDVRMLVDLGAGFVEQERGVAYVVAPGDWLANGANLVFQPGYRPPAGTAVWRSRNTAPQQPAQFGDLSAFRPTQNEEALDRLTRMQQEARSDLARTLQLPPGEGGILLPGAEGRGGRLLAFDAAGGVNLIDAVAVLSTVGVFVDDGAWGDASEPLTHDDGPFA